MDNAYKLLRMLTEDLLPNKQLEILPELIDHIGGIDQLVEKFTLSLMVLGSKEENFRNTYEKFIEVEAHNYLCDKYDPARVVDTFRELNKIKVEDYKYDFKAAIVGDFLSGNTEVHAGNASILFLEYVEEMGLC